MVLWLNVWNKELLTLRNFFCGDQKVPLKPSLTVFSFLCLGVKISIIIYQGGAGKLVYRQVYGLGSRDFQVFSVSAIFLTLWKKSEGERKKSSFAIVVMHWHCTLDTRGLKFLKKY